MVYNFFDKKTGSRVQMSANGQVAEELHKPVIKKFKKRKIYVRYKDNIWAPDLAEIRSLSSKIENVKCVINVFTKYAWVKLLKDKKR